MRQCFFYGFREPRSSRRRLGLRIQVEERGGGVTGERSSFVHLELRSKSCHAHHQAIVFIDAEQPTDPAIGNRRCDDAARLARPPQTGVKLAPSPS